jgi:radical SAM protein with 4Fe4S-binding SPASM domain
MWFISDENAEEHNRIFGNLYPVSKSCFNEYVNPAGVDIECLHRQISELKERPKVNFLPAWTKTELEKFYKNTGVFMRPGARCMASWFIIQILANGNVIPYSRCHNKSFGNINNNPFLSVWNGPEIKQWRRFIKKNKKMPMCKRCDLVY